MQDSTQQSAGVSVFTLLVAGLLLLTAGKIFLASALDLYSDEVFYWQASANPALAYSDLPFMTALLIGLGSAIDTGNTLAARSLFLLMGTCLPGLVYWLARPVTNHHLALESAGISLCLPLAGFLGVLAVPDVPLLFFGLLSIGFFERALRTNYLLHWVLTGVVVALGLCTHYRFFLYPAAAIIFLLFFKDERRQWKNPGLWVSIGISSLGLIPILWFNLSHQLSSASFYFVDRHPWEFQFSGLLHIFRQAGIVTPPLYLIFVYTVYQLLVKARRSDRNAALVLSFSLLNILLYLLLAPWTDATSTSIHWPLSGYFPLLVFVPSALRSASKIAGNYFTPKLAHRLLLLVPAIGFAGTLTALIAVGSQAFQTQLQAIIGTGLLSSKMAGWKQFSAHTREILTQDFESAPILITDNYYTLAQVEFSALSDQGFTLDNDKAVRDGRITQYQLWQQDSVELGKISGSEFLFITEDSTLDNSARYELLAELCARSEHLQHLGKLLLFNGDKQFSFYKGHSLTRALKPPAFATTACPFPAMAWIDAPHRGAELRGLVEVNGWAYNEDIGIESINLLIDGERVGQVDYGGSRPDVVEVKQVRSDPNKPNIGYNYSFDSNLFENGKHRLQIEIRNRLGITQLYGQRTVEISN